MSTLALAHRDGGLSRLRLTTFACVRFGFVTQTRKSGGAGPELRVSVSDTLRTNAKAVERLELRVSGVGGGGGVVGWSGRGAVVAVLFVAVL